VKNTFKKLRAKLRYTLNKLDTANRTSNILSVEVERLKRVLDIQQKKEAVLNSQLETEKKRASRLTDQIMVIKNNREFFYKQWISEHSKIKKWQVLSYVSVASNIVMLFFMIVRG